MQGIHIINDAQSVQISTETIPMVYQYKTVHNLKNTQLVNLQKNDGSISVFLPKVSGDGSLWRHGIFPPFGGVTCILRDDNRVQNGDLIIEEYIFKPQVVASTNVGLQIFDHNGTELFNSDSRLLSLIKKYEIDPSTSWYTESGRPEYQYTIDTASAHKIGFLFTNLPAGITKSPSMSQIYAYDYRFWSDDGIMMFAVGPQVWSWSFSNAHIPIDRSLRTEFFTVNLDNIN
ncbi:hypothetical protein [Moraxella lacunata]|uniref:Uncharacterized protein n=1 Tax=Moraxella lacunata TaxID=477 RepID=A0A1V4GWL2_MORLA|nr:hypothetical protein [Moraxella lacunata]OPH36516.1 hypothetical protein B5J94_07230 [Moraxella lacunata]